MNPTTTLPSGACILVIDDTPANLAVAVDHLEAHGLRVLVAQDGEEGIRRAQFAIPDLILLDVTMPGIDGFETCRRLKADPATRDIPVIFMTALAATPDKLAGFEAGGVDYLTKPFSASEMLARISVHLALAATQRELARRNAALEHEIAERSRAQAALQQAYDELKLATARLEQTRGQLLASEKTTAAGIIDPLHDLSPASGGEWQLTDLHAGIDGTLRVLADALGDKIEVLREYGPLPEVECRPAALHGIFLHALLNAVQSTPEGGRIRIRSELQEGLAWIEIADNAEGGGTSVRIALPLRRTGA